MKRAALVLLAACGSAPPAPRPAANVMPQVPDDAERAIPKDAVLVTYEPPVPGTYWQECTPTAQGLYTVRLADQRGLDIVVADTSRDALVRCFAAKHGDGEGKLVTPSYAGEHVDIVDGRGLIVRVWWHPHYYIFSRIDRLPEPDPGRAATFRAMRGAKYAVWTRLPFVRELVGVDARELVVRFTEWEPVNNANRPWLRRGSGTLAIELDSEADASAVAAKLAAPRALGFDYYVWSKHVTAAGRAVRGTFEHLELDPTKLTVGSPQRAARGP